VLLVEPLGTARVRDLFEPANIVFIDELDTLGKARRGNHALGQGCFILKKLLQTKEKIVDIIISLFLEAFQLFIYLIIFSNF
jgi:hypothetical protein